MVEEEVLSVEEKQSNLRQQYQQMLLDAYQAGNLENEDVIDDQFVGDEMPQNSNIVEDEDEQCWDPPYSYAQAMLLDIMDNFPRCRFTSAQMSLIIQFAKDLGVPNVPSIKGLRKIQQSLQSSCGTVPTRIESTQGNIFYMNDIRDTIAHDLANPLVFQAERWTEYTPEQLTPMFTKGRWRFWVNEIAQLEDGTFVLPQLLVVRNQDLEADISEVIATADGRWELQTELKSKKASEFDRSYDEIVEEFGGFTWVDDSQVPEMPNCMRTLVDEDEDLFVIMVSPWADDVSGNKSKQYNKHMNMYTGNGCLPGPLLQQEFHVHYISSSPHASSAEQFSAFRDHVKSTETTPVKAYNAATKRNSRFILRVPGLPADNPQQSEEASHMGSNANHPCRKCHWGGTAKEKETEQLYHECHLAGALRSAEEIRANLQNQLQLAMRGDAEGVKKLQRATGTKDKIAQYWIELLICKFQELKAESRRRTVDDLASDVLQWFGEQPGDKMNPLLDIAGLDPSQDTPLELLHTILLALLLGVIKYIWHHMNTEKWSDTDRHLLAIRLQSTDITGLTIPPIRAAYMIQYKNNLIGKHFKTVMQILFALIKAAAELCARPSVPEIDDMDDYLAQVEIAVANLLDAFDAVDPLRILTKIKLHLLAHTRHDIRRFGPLIRSSTEIYEAFNGVFRLCSVYSNHLAPSRDIARKFASMARVKHMLSGGYWWDPHLKQWVQAEGAVLDVLQTDRGVQRHLGWVSPKIAIPGKVEPKPLRKNPAVEWENSTAFKQWSAANGTSPQPQSLWQFGRTLSAQSGDIVTVGNWVVGKNLQGNTVFGRVCELLTADQAAFVTLEQFICSQHLHRDFSWPVLRRPNGPKIMEGVRIYCQPAVAETNRQRSLIKHTDDDHFIINMGAFHNFTKLCRLKPLVSRQARAGRDALRKKTAATRRHNAETKKREAEEAERAARDAEQAAREGRDLEDDDDESDDASSRAGEEGDKPDSEDEPDSDGEAVIDDEEEPPVNVRGRKRKRARIS
ncbi:hypothetical protein DFH07DRAFT_867863 [Mycena maculata]|uniref:Uncharacterized protein n=1 Tax=Mycena maculata TaxID=230809 RepID=A0AAD7NFP9_9AGAR|nr:hypothetical protein DFH07DRAFT_867863 [Mycena maculata]